MFEFFVSPKEEIENYKNVILDATTGLIVESNGKYVLDQSDEILYWTPETYGRAIKRGSNKKLEFESRTKSLLVIARILQTLRPKLNVLPEGVNYIYLMHPFGFFAFGHFYDSLQRLKNCLNIVPEPWKIVHSRSGRIIDFTKHMELIGVDESRLVQLTQPVLAPNLWVTPWQAAPTQFSEDGYDWLYDRYTKNLKEHEPTRLYLSRNHVREGERSVTNEAEILDLLVREGFEVLTGKEPLETIITKFYNAEMVIGPHGALFGHTMFCPPTCRVLELCADNRVERCFKNRTKKSEHYEHVLLPGDEHFNIEIPIELIQAFVEG